jgi:hypothetical protein
MRNVAVDLGTVRRTDPKTGRRVTFDTPAAVCDALLGFARGVASGLQRASALRS